MKFPEKNDRRQWNVTANTSFNKVLDKNEKCLFFFPNPKELFGQPNTWQIWKEKCVNSLAFQQLGLQAYTEWGQGSIPDPGNEISHAKHLAPPKKKLKKSKVVFSLRLLISHGPRYLVREPPNSKCSGQDKILLSSHQQRLDGLFSTQKCSEQGQLKKKQLLIFQHTALEKAIKTFSSERVSAAHDGWLS